MQYIRITSENIDSEHICCAMSGKQSVAKKAWLKERVRGGAGFLPQRGAGQVLHRVHPGRKRVGSHRRAGVSLHQLPVDRRVHEGAWVFLRPAGRVHPGRQSAGAAGDMHPFCGGQEAGVSFRPQVSGLQGLYRRGHLGLRDHPHVSAADAVGGKANVQGMRQTSGESRRTASFSTIRISVRSPITGCPGWRRPPQSTAFP